MTVYDDPPKNRGDCGNSQDTAGGTTARLRPVDRRSYDGGVIPWTDGPGIVEFPDGRRIRGRGLRHPPRDGQDPQFAVYLLARDPGPFDWEHCWVRWPDFRTPASTNDAICALQEAYERSATQRVEIACGGGVGRTGTALAGIAVLAGVPRAEAVAWVRRRYHKRAAETPWQRRWVLEVDGIR
jgi:Protein-tyrosine phosphatase